MNNKVTTAGGTEATQVVPDTVRLVASRFFFAYDEKYGEFHKKIHGDNPRYAELKGVVDTPQEAPDGTRNPYGRILDAWDVYDTSFCPKGHTLVTVCGGYNGGGSDHKWCEYLGEISGAVRRLVDRFGNAWLVDLSEHSDVWYATIGFEDRRDMSESAGQHGAPGVRIARDDFAAYADYLDAALKARLPFGLVDWGHRSYDWAWAKLGGPYAFPRTAFHGSLISPTNTAYQYATFDADAACFRDACGVYAAHNGTETFFVVTARTREALDAAIDDKGVLRSFGTLPAKDFQILEDLAVKTEETSA